MKKLLLLLIAVSFINCGGGDDDDIDTPVVIPEIESIPEITTKALVKITANSAYSGGNISSNGNNSIIRKGVCWSKTSIPSISAGATSNFSVDGKGVSSYESILDELDPNTTYYVRSYATNGKGTGYGNEISFTTSDGSFPEKVFTGDVYLTNQQEVDTFGANNYTHINGGLYIDSGAGTGSSVSDVTNLDAFISLRIVQDYFVLVFTGITSLEGLNNLEEVGDVFDIRVAQNLLSLSALSNLNVIGGGLNINDTLIEDLEGLNNIQSLGSLSLEDNLNLQNIDALNNLESIQGYFSIRDNSSLNNLDGLSNLTSASGFYIENNNSLVNIDGLSSLTFVPSYAYIQSNSELVNLNGLSNLNSVGDDLRILGNLILNDFCGIQPSLISGMSGNYTVYGNAYNPTEQDLIDGNCSQ